MPPSAAAVSDKSRLVVLLEHFGTIASIPLRYIPISLRPAALQSLPYIYQRSPFAVIFSSHLSL